MFRKILQRHFHDEVLTSELFSTDPEAQILADRWR